MTDLERHAKEYMKNHFCKKVDEKYMIEECEKGEERAERIIRSKIDGSYKDKPVVVTLDKESE